MIQVVRAEERELQPVDIPGIRVEACDPVVGKDGCLSAGFSKYLEPCRLEWTFSYNEVFFMLEGSLEIQVPGEESIEFESGDLGYIEEGTQTTIVVDDSAYFVHFTHPAWSE